MGGGGLVVESGPCGHATRMSVLQIALSYYVHADYASHRGCAPMQDKFVCHSNYNFI